jgi:hypothetical protein
MIAIEMCRILQTKTNTKVSGIILIDTPSTQHWTSLGPDVVKYEPEVTSTSAWVRQGVKRRFEVAGDLVDNWQFPSASDLKRPGSEPQIPMEGCSYRAFPIAAPGHPSGAAAAGTGMARLKFDRDFNNSLRLQHRRGLLPPTMLLRAVEAVPKTSANEESQFRIDLDRDSPLLGWERGAINFIRVVQDTPGNHYNMFEGDKQVTHPQNRPQLLCTQTSNYNKHRYRHLLVPSTHGVRWWMISRGRFIRNRATKGEEILGTVVGFRSNICTHVAAMGASTT